jgi:hypothetical protein
LTMIQKVHNEGDRAVRGETVPVGCGTTINTVLM